MWHGRKYLEGQRDANTDYPHEEEPLLAAGLGNDGVDEYALGFGMTIARRLRDMGREVSAAKVLWKTSMVNYEKVAFLVDEAKVLVWRLDPDHDGVVGLVLEADRDHAVAVVYLEEGDIETTHLLEELFRTY